MPGKRESAGTCAPELAVTHVNLNDGTVEGLRHRDLPVFIWITGDGPEEFFYGFPAIDGPDGGLKVASEQFQDATTPAAWPMNRTLAKVDTARPRASSR